MPMTESNRAPADPMKVLEELMRQPPRRAEPKPESREERELREFEADWRLSEDAQKKFVSRYAEGSVNLHFGRYKTTEDLDRDRERILGRGPTRRK